MDDDCCAVPSSAGCAEGYTYSYDEKSRCLRSDSWKAFTTICTPCTDALDQKGAEKPWYDFVSCAEEAPFCNSNDVVRQGCAKTCGTCGSSNGLDELRTTTTTTTTTAAAARRMLGGARLSYEGCVGCKEFFASTAATSVGALDWESCLGAGITIRTSVEAISVSFNDDLCGADMSPGPKTYGQLSTHAVGFRIVDDVTGALPVYVLATANAGAFVAAVAVAVAVIAACVAVNDAAQQQQLLLLLLLLRRGVEHYSAEPYFAAVLPCLTIHSHWRVLLCLLLLPMLLLASCLLAACSVLPCWTIHSHRCVLLCLLLLPMLLLASCLLCLLAPSRRAPPPRPTKTGDGSLQLVWNFLEHSTSVTMEFSITKIEGTFLGWTSVPTGTSPAASAGSATLTMLDYIDSNSGDGVNTCGNLLILCDGLHEAMAKGDFTMSMSDSDL